MVVLIDESRLADALDLVNRVFLEFVAVDYTPEGQKSFEQFLFKMQEMAVTSSNIKIWGYLDNNKIVGVIATRDTSHISLLFVDANQQGKGIARQLLSTVLEDVKNNSAITKITVNSSPYAVTAYEHLGFVKKEDIQEKDGIVFLPMEIAI